VLSFAGIALIAAVILGVVLLVILQDYYSNLELAYLRTNAQAIADLMDALSSRNTPHDEVQSQIKNMAFLTETRIQMFNSDDVLLYDSGSPQNIDVHLINSNPMPSEQAGDNKSGSAPSTFGGTGNTIQFSSPGDATSSASGVNQKVFVYTYSVPGASPIGFATNTESITGGERSKAEFVLTIRNSSSSATVKLSEGPAYGRAILRNVARGWAIAGSIAVLLAASIGWYISRRMSAPVLALREVAGHMAQGDLSSRAAVQAEDEFGQLALAFNEMADQVETTVTTLRAFVADAAHELRTPLTGLRANLDLLSEEKDAAHRATFLADAKTMVQRLEALNSNLLDLSRLEANDPSARDVVVDLTELLQERIPLYASQAEQAGLVFQQDLPSVPVWTRANRNEIGRAIDNLVDNACKFTPQDGSVAFTLSTLDGQALISVLDTGIGIPADELPRLFHRFHRGRNVSPYPGSGLGLAIVKAIVIAHQGQIEAQSAGEGRGSKFSILLPTVLR
jgi:signal transduction histidine kinase